MSAPTYADRLKQEVAACRCAGDAKQAIDDHREQIDRLTKAMREELYRDLIDIMRELPA